MADADGNSYAPYDIEVEGSQSEPLDEANWYEFFGHLSGVKSGGALTFNGLTANLAPINMRVHGSKLVRVDPWSEASPATPSGGSPRRDMLVARRQLTSGSGEAAIPGKTFLTILQGTPAASPAEPVYDEVNDEPLWSWQVPGNGGTVITVQRDLRLKLSTNGLVPLIVPITGPTNATPVRTTEVDSWANFVEPGLPGGRPYRIRTTAVVTVAANGCVASTRIRVGSSALSPGTEPVVSDVIAAYNANGVACSHPARKSGVITGPARIVGHALRTSGTGGWQVSPAPSLVYEVIPE